MSPLEFLSGIPGPGAVLDFPLRALKPEEMEWVEDMVKAIGQDSQIAQRWRDGLTYGQGMNKAGDKFHDLLGKLQDLAERVGGLRGKSIRREASDFWTPYTDEHLALQSQLEDLTNHYERINKSGLRVADPVRNEMQEIFEIMGGPPPKPFK